MIEHNGMTRRAVLASGLGLGLAACARESSSDASLMSGQTISVNGKTLHYVLEGSGPPVILLHGASGNLRDWTFSLFDRLAQDYRVLAFDRPGLGLSEAANDPSLSEQSRLMREAAKALEMEHATLVGQSFGGAVALAWAIDAPGRVDGLVLISAPSQVWPGSVGGFYSVTNFPGVGYVFSNLVPFIVTQGTAERALRSIFEPQPVPVGYLAHMRPELALNPASFRNNAAQVGSLKAQMRKMVPAYQTFEMPIELIHGDADDVVPIEIHSEPFARTVKGARLTRLEGVGHMPHHSHQDTVLAAIKRATGR